MVLEFGIQRGCFFCGGILVSPLSTERDLRKIVNPVNPARPVNPASIDRERLASLDLLACWIYQYMIYLLHITTLIVILLVLCWSMQLSIGYTGILNLAHVAFMGVGAYVAVIAVKSYHLPLPLAFLFAILSPLPLAWLLSRLTQKVHGDYLALMTLWFSFVVYVVELNLTGITRGPLGISNIFLPGIGHTPESFFYLSTIIALSAYFLIRRIVHSPFGRVMAALRDDEVSATVLGKNTVRVKQTVFLVSSMFAGLAGALFAFFIHFIDPSSFHLPLLVSVLTFLIVGGLGSLRATTVGVIALVILQESLRFFPLSNEGIGAMRQILYALMLLLILYYRPKGMLGRVQLPA